MPFSLQFSELRDDKSYSSSKMLLSKEMVKINEFINKYRDSLSDDVYNSQEYSIKLVQIPVVSNASKNDIAIQFISWDKLTEEEKREVNKVTTLIKTKNIFRDMSNVDRLMPGMAVKKIKEKIKSYNQNINTYLVYIFSIKPSKAFESDKDAFETNTKYCYYDQTHDDYQYTYEWVEFVIDLISNSKLTIEDIKRLYQLKRKLDISEYE